MTELYGCKVIDGRDDAALVQLKNDIFDTVAMILWPETDQEEIFFLTDWQGETPESLADAPDFDWVALEDVDF